MSDELIGFLDKYRVTYDNTGRNKNRPGWVNVRCPKCDRYPYCGINLNRMYANAWCCGPMRLDWVLSTLTGVPIAQCREVIGDPRPFYGKEVKPRGTLQEPPFRGELLPAHRSYLEGRGFDPDELVKLWRVGGVNGFNGRIPWFVYIPVIQDGRVVTWTSRRITDKDPRYISARVSESEIPIEDCVYGRDYVVNTTVIMEGPTGVWRVGPGATALLGLRLSSAQLDWLASIPRRYVCFDAEWQAQERAHKLLRDLSVLDGKTTNLVLEGGNDPASTSEEEVEYIRGLIRQ